MTDTIIKASEVSFNEGVLRLAAVHERAVEFRYAKGDEKIIETRSFVPTSVATSAKGAVYFTGPDPDRDGEHRAYRVDRIKGDVEFT
jgi:hypothetical protein